MNILIIPDSFKGSLSSVKVSDAICDGVMKILPNSFLKKIPFSDGGEGAIDFLNQNFDGEIEYIDTENSLGLKMEAPIYWLKKNKIAWIELSQASGLSNIRKKEMNPMKTSTFGSGLLINHVLKSGCKKIYIGLGGSSTHDMGSGIFIALGGILLNSESLPVLKGGQGLLDCESIDFRNLNSNLKNCEIILAVDVNNQLLGLNGAAKTYSPQKGATIRMIEKLESGSIKFSKLIKKTTNKDVTTIKGGGAAGGTAAGLYGLISARIKSGFDIFSELIELESQISRADLIISGEGHLDYQSSYGKLVGKVGALAKKYKKPLICIAGKVSLKSKESKALGITSAWPIKPKNYTLKKSMDNAYDLVKKSTEIAIKYHLNQ